MNPQYIKATFLVTGLLTKQLAMEKKGLLRDEARLRVQKATKKVLIGSLVIVAIIDLVAFFVTYSSPDKALPYNLTFLWSNCFSIVLTILLIGAASNNYRLITGLSGLALFVIGMVKILTPPYMGLRIIAGSGNIFASGTAFSLATMFIIPNEVIINA